MKRYFLLIAAAAFAFMACNKENNAPEPEAEASEYYDYQTLQIPSGTDKIFISYQTVSGQEKVAALNVTPKATKAEGKNAEPFGTVNLLVKSSEKNAKYSVYYMFANGKKVNLSENVISHVGTKAATKATDVSYTLNEPATYTSTDEAISYYHSSGSVMIEDSWPNGERTGAYDVDFNDVIIDYDFEATIVPDWLLESQGWRENVKVCLHIRGIGSKIPRRLGVILEGLNTNNLDVENIADYKTLDSWQNPHGALPEWTVNTLQKNSRHYESDPMRPCVEIGDLQCLNRNNSGAGTEEYTRFDDNGNSHQTVFNLLVNNYKAMDESQFDASIKSITEPIKFSKILESKYYNVIPGYINVDGGLYTYTVIYPLKSRAKMSATDKQAVIDNIINSIMVSTNQNFYVIREDGTPVHLKGYQVADFKVLTLGSGNGYLNNGYKTKYDQVLNANQDKLDLSTTFVGKNGEVWGVKCPTLTKHVWNKLYVTMAYPHLESFIKSNGTTNQNWYESDVVNKYLVCEW